MNIFNYPDFFTERKFMEEHPWLGEYHNYLIVGNPIKPPQDSPEEIKVSKGRGEGVIWGFCLWLANQYHSHVLLATRATI